MLSTIGCSKFKASKITIFVEQLSGTDILIRILTSILANTSQSTKSKVAPESLVTLLRFLGLFVLLEVVLNRCYNHFP